MSNIIIREAILEDAKGIGHVRYKSWQETYTGIINQEYLDNMSLEKSVEIAENCIETTLAAEIENNIVAYLHYANCKEAELEDCAVITAVYVLKEHQKKGIGKALIDSCISKLKGYKKLILWVVEGNLNAIGFYEKYGFSLDGEKKEITLVTPVVGVRMIMEL